MAHNHGTYKLRTWLTFLTRYSWRSNHIWCWHTHIHVKSVRGWVYVVSEIRCVPELRGFGDARFFLNLTDHMSNQYNLLQALSNAKLIAFLLHYLNQKIDKFSARINWSLTNRLIIRFWVKYVIFANRKDSSYAATSEMQKLCISDIDCIFFWHYNFRANCSDLTHQFTSIQ